LPAEFENVIILCIEKYAMNNRYRQKLRYPDPKPIGGIIDTVIARLGLTKRYHGWMAVRDWPHIVGDFNAARSNAYRYEDGTLYVAIEDSALRQELSLQAGMIMAEIHKKPYGRAVKQVRFTSGAKGN
jgi:hypothetical protein